MSEVTLQTTYLLNKGFTPTDNQYKFKKGDYFVEFTPRGCALYHNDDLLTKFDGLVSAFNETWELNTGEKP